MPSAILPDKIPSSGFAFSIHKAGSTLMHEMIRDVCAARNIPAISLPDLFFNQGILDHEWAYDPKVLKDIYAGRVYYGFRHLPPILMGPEVKTLMQKSVLLIRDPRDILVSQFFRLADRMGRTAFRQTRQPLTTINMRRHVRLINMC